MWRLAIALGLSVFRSQNPLLTSIVSQSNVRTEASSTPTPFANKVQDATKNTKFLSKLVQANCIGYFLWTLWSCFRIFVNS